MSDLGRTTWVIAEGYIPSGSTGECPALESHEAACVLNAADVAVLLQITLYFSDREPVGPYRFEVPPRRTRHLRFNDFDPPVPRDTDYASVIEASAPVVVQHTRLDSRQPALALLSTIAFAQE